ncbi:hypothetical protein P3G55_25770, partial [Leptospira sp. 96542]|nr:hypothetical protein [Leptospira sp. 96542]
MNRLLRAKPPPCQKPSRICSRAVQAARRAFPAYAETSVAQRLEWLNKIIAGFRARLPELART